MVCMMDIRRRRRQMRTHCRCQCPSRQMRRMSGPPSPFYGYFSHKPVTNRPLVCEDDAFSKTAYHACPLFSRTLPGVFVILLNCWCRFEKLALLCFIPTVGCRVRRAGLRWRGRAAAAPVRPVPRFQQAAGRLRSRGAGRLDHASTMSRELPGHPSAPSTRTRVQRIVRKQTAKPLANTARKPGRLAVQIAC